MKPEKIIPGQSWKEKETGYILKILDVGKTDYGDIDLWVEYENGNKGHWKKSRFLENYEMVKMEAKI